MMQRGIKKLQEFFTDSCAETEALAERFSKKIDAGTVIAMQGDLGAGKTCFVRGFAKGLGYSGDVNSPTFAIVNVYLGGRLALYHFDMYRVSSWDDLYSTGFFDYLDAGGIMIIEWSENIVSALPSETVFIKIESLSEGRRKITIEGEGNENIRN